MVLVCRSCCSPAAKCASLCVRVTGCTQPLIGATVDLIQGGNTIATGVTDGQIPSITLVSAGSGYTPGSIPAVTISGGGGSGATAVAVMNANGTGVARYFMTGFGTGYTSVPAVTIASPPSGTQATATAVFAAQSCLGFDSSGSTTVRVTGPGGKFVVLNSVQNPTCTRTTITLAVSPATGYSCTRESCCVVADQPGPPPYKAIVYPSQLYVTDPFGTVTIPSIGGNPPTYRNSAPRISVNSQNPCGTAALTGAPVPVFFTVSCTGPAQWALNVGPNRCTVVNDGAATVSLSPKASAFYFPSTCTTLAATCTVDPTTSAITDVSYRENWYDVYGTNPVTFTVSN